MWKLFRPQNNLSEKEARWGSTTVQGSGHQDSLSMAELRQKVVKTDSDLQEKRLATMPKPSLGYGGKYGVQNDRVDKASAPGCLSCV